MQQSGRVIDSCAGAPLFSLTVSWLHWLQLHWLPVTVQCAVQLYICTLSDKIIALACITLVSLIALRGTSSARWLQFSCDLHQCCYSSLHTSLFYLSSDCIGRDYYYTSLHTSLQSNCWIFVRSSIIKIHDPVHLNSGVTMGLSSLSYPCWKYWQLSDSTGSHWIKLNKSTLLLGFSLFWVLQYFVLLSGQQY